MGTLKGVQVVHSVGRAVAKACHPRRVEAIRHCLIRCIKPEYLYYQLLDGSKSKFVIVSGIILILLGL